MNLVAYEPRDFLDSFFANDDFFDRHAAGFDFPVHVPHADLRVNIAETPDNYTLVAEAPGLNDKDLDVEIKDGVLTLKGHQKKEEETENETYRVREFSERSFERSFRIGDTVDQDNITAKLHNGLLRVTIPKKEEAKARTAKIKIES